MKASAKLPPYEWGIILLFCAILTSLAALAFWRQPSSTSLPSPPEPLISELQITIQGEVAHPGLYQLPLNSSLKELLEQAQPLSNADLSRLNWRRKLRDGQTIRIPAKKWITINVTGAVLEPGPLKILSGTRQQEIADQINPLPEADMTAFRKRRRFLQDGDSVDVPVKKKKACSKILKR